MKGILLLGAGGHCESILDALERCVEFDEIAIIDASKKGNSILDRYKVIGGDDDLAHLRREGYDYAFVAVGSIGDSATREKLYAKIKQLEFAIPTIIDPSASVSAYAKLGEGVFVGKNAIINAGVIIGKMAIINTGAIVEHDSVIGDYAHTAPGAVVCGNCRVGSGSHIGANATIIQGVSVGNHSVVGAGSVVIRDIGDNLVVAGNPSRIIRGKS